MVVLTYHRTPALPGVRDFYAVHAEALSAQLDVLRARGYAPGSFDDLTQSAAPARHFILTFDDATADHAKVAAPLLEARGLRGVFFIPTAKLDQPDRMTSADVAELGRRGHEIGSHSHEHRRLDLMSTDQVRSQLAASLSILGRLTENQPRAFAAPGGYTNKKVRRVATECGMMVQRTMRWGLNENTEAMELETIPMHAGMTAEDLGRILSGAGLLRWRLRYKAKEAFKQLLPLSSYEIVRKALTNHLK
jgi:peptidoglycan/xylan/chitin deacetylase (PgdA/CDA1 family)